MKRGHYQHNARNYLISHYANLTPQLSARVGRRMNLRRKRAAKADIRDSGGRTRTGTANLRLFSRKVSEVFRR
jgi:hypothetical protein